MIGETPRNDQFAKVFDWTDAVVHLPFGSDQIDVIINELDKQPDRQEKIRRDIWFNHYCDMIGYIGGKPCSNRRA